MLKESVIEKKSISAAKQQGWWAIKLVPSFIKGLPDRMYIGHGKVVFIEYKTEIGKLSSFQVFIHNKFKKHGIKVYTCRSVDETLEVLNKELQNENNN
jgi:hypothetical protein